MKFPYAMSVFAKIIRGDYVYVDRTQHIQFLEDWGKTLLFLRPRRFGKSLWLSTLMDYYDVTKADEFEELFGKLAIGQNPTPLHNQYLVMRWDFSRVHPHGTAQAIEEDLHKRINGDIRSFLTRHRAIFPQPPTLQPTDALESFNAVLSEVQALGHELYLFIDEYDNFANEVMMSVRNWNGTPTMDSRYEDLVQGEGLFKTFFKNIKSFGSGQGLDRVFITGVSPIVMNDVSSGANVFDDIYWFKELNDFCGFYEHEVAEMLAGVIEDVEKKHQSTIDPEEALNLMRTYYDGSWFTTEAEQESLQQPAISYQPSAFNFQPSERLYNPTMVFYFLRQLQRLGTYPDQMLDRNLRSDRGKLYYIAHYAQGRSLLVEGLNGKQEIRVSEVGKDFSAKEMLQPDMGHDRLASLLCYLGALTVAGRDSGSSEVRLAVPNLVMQRMYAERIHEMAITDMQVQRELMEAANKLLHEGEIEPLCDHIEANIMSIYSNRDYPEFKELALKSVFISMLYHNPFYTIHSEPELHRRYGDLLMLLRPNAYHFKLFNLLLEFKQVALSDVIEKLPEDDKQAGKKNKKKGKPLTDEQVRERSRESLLNDIPSVKKAMDEAKKQLRSYQQTLYRLYGPEWRLVSYAVIGVGLGRIVFERVEPEL